MAQDRCGGEGDPMTPRYLRNPRTGCCHVAAPAGGYGAPVPACVQGWRDDATVDYDEIDAPGGRLCSRCFLSEKALPPGDARKGRCDFCERSSGHRGVWDHEGFDVCDACWPARADLAEIVRNRTRPQRHPAPDPWDGYASWPDDARPGRARKVPAKPALESLEREASMFG